MQLNLLERRQLFYKACINTNIDINVKNVYFFHYHSQRWVATSPSIKCYHCYTQIDVKYVYLPFSIKLNHTTYWYVMITAV